MAQPEGRGRPAPPAPSGTDPLDRLDDPDRPTYTIGQAAELLGVQVAFLRSLDSSGVVEPARSSGGHRRWSRAQLRVAARVRVLLDDGHPLGSAEVIIGLQDDVAALQDRLDRS
ncbi:helix-turn-helix domain-containing protein [Klenkia brasiliensis]|uniref:MerR HTH family regulatory protein n=1 Tax=Klenkia brasiliensis TaxID=333142 RepID=A0A1G7TB21_9ACTN|nr:helix-turn-helix domain-containing protein [Klenkia brasiliensis]SDG32506.1 MerR HTH family regulatory protein [Klenkia brasiliensis]